MRFSLRPLLLGLAALVAVPAAHAATPASPPPSPASGVEDCLPGAACSHPLPVRIVIVSMFEVGEDSGDAPGEFQLWKERRKLDTRIPFPQGWHDLYYNPKTQVLGMVTGVGTNHSATGVMALGLDQRFDLSKAYWLVAGIAGVDPEDASIGSAAWARYVVDGDLAHEIDAREMPKDWKNGFFPLDKQGPNDKTPPNPRDGELFALNPGLTAWAFGLTKDIRLPDEAGAAKERAKYVGYPKALTPPRVLVGDQLSAMTFWHGKLMNDWANDWVRYWTQGKGEFVTSAMEETGTMQALTFLDRIHRADYNRVLVLRSASNYTMPPPGVTAADYLAQENSGYSGMRASLEALYTVGSKVIDTLLADWPRYEKTVPQ